MGKDTIQAPTGSEDLKVWADAPEVQLLLPLEDSGGPGAAVAATPAAQPSPPFAPVTHRLRRSSAKQISGRSLLPELDSSPVSLTQKSVGHV